MLAVTHDRYFLDHVAEWILEIDAGRVFTFKGNYNQWLAGKQVRTRASFDTLTRTRKTNVEIRIHNMHIRIQIHVHIHTHEQAHKRIFPLTSRCACRWRVRHPSDKANK